MKRHLFIGCLIALTMLGLTSCNKSQSGETVAEYKVSEKDIGTANAIQPVPR